MSHASHRFTGIDDKCLKDVEPYDVFPFMAGFTRLAYRGYHRPTGRRVVVMLVNECIEKSREENSYHRLERDVLLTHASPRQYVPEILCESTTTVGGGVIVTEYLSLVLSEKMAAKFTDNTVPSALALLPYSKKLQLAKSAVHLVQAFDSFPLATLTSGKDQNATFDIETKPILYADFTRLNFGFNDQLELKVIDIVSLNNVVFHEGKAIADETPCRTNRDCVEAIVKLVRPTKTSFALLGVLGENASDCSCNANDGTKGSSTAATRDTMGYCHGMDQRAHMRAMCVLYIRPLILFSNEVERLGETHGSSQSEEKREALIKLSRRIAESACSNDAEKRLTVQEVLSGIDQLLNMTGEWEDAMEIEDNLRLQQKHEEDLSLFFHFSKPNLVPSSSFMHVTDRWSKQHNRKGNCSFVGNLKTGLYHEEETPGYTLRPWNSALTEAETDLRYIYIVQVSVFTFFFAVVLLNRRYIARVGTLKK